MRVGSQAAARRRGVLFFRLSRRSRFDSQRPWGERPLVSAISRLILGWGFDRRHFLEGQLFVQLRFFINREKKIQARDLSYSWPIKKLPHHRLKIAAFACKQRAEKTAGEDSRITLQEVKVHLMDLLVENGISLSEFERSQFAAHPRSDLFANAPALDSAINVTNLGNFLIDQYNHWPRRLLRRIIQKVSTTLPMFCRR